jgi:hypothetical protein
VHQIVEAGASEWLEVPNQIDHESAEGKAYGVQAVLFVDD